ncbi:MAG TPA: acyltransferase [Verrucomicrobiae bacterium]|nr:acyltransferase [Verrucomicrobiae bacterium]
MARILNFSARQSMRLRVAWHRRKFIFIERPRHKKIELGTNIVFFVPVRGGGKGVLRVGNGTKFGFPMTFRLGNGEILLQAREPDAEIVIGENNLFSNNIALCAVRNIQIGDNCLIGDSVSVVDADFHEINPATRNRSVGTVKPVKIGNNVWIGSRTMILKGVTIGDNSVIGAMSLVTGEIPANCVAAGVPAKVIRKIEQQ